MNRLCQSSYGNLEAVINLANFRGHNERRLVHFSRDRITGEWDSSAVVSEGAKTGGSIIQNVSKRHAKQDHGDFEVLVLEADGAVKHYTRDNSIPDEYVWKTSAVVNATSEFMLTNTNATEAVPLVQSQISLEPYSYGTCLETAILEDNRSMVHYRCPQPARDINGNVVDQMHCWSRSSTICHGATGPACLYQPTPDSLMALVPIISGIGRYRLHPKSNGWTTVAVLPEMTGPGCVYTIPTPGEILFHAFIRNGFDIEEKVCREPSWQDTGAAMPASFDRIRDSPYHTVFPTNPIAIASQSNNGLGDSPNTEAIVFHASGTGYQDAWMVVHWTLPAGRDEWVISSVLLRHVIGMPL